MTEVTDHRQSRFGLIATLICIVIIFALLMPAVQDVRTPTRRNECTNRIKNLALATVNFDGTNGCYPTYQSEFGGKSGGPVKLGSWVASLMPYLEHQALRDTWDDPSEQGNWINFEKDVVSNSPKRARPNAHHQGIVNAAMADGSTKAIAEEIDYHVYQALMTPHTRQSDAPNVLYLLKEDDFSL